MKKILSIIVIITVLVSMLTLAFANEQKTVLGLGYTEEEKAFAIETGFDIDKYEAGIQESGSHIVDGNIVIENVETIDFIAESMQKYWERMYADNINRDLKIYRTIVVGFNTSSISNNIISQLLDENLILNPMPYGADKDEERFNRSYLKCLTIRRSYLGDVLDKAKNDEIVIYKEDSVNQENSILYLYILATPFIFDYKTRECAKVMEQYDLYYLSANSIIDFVDDKDKFNEEMVDLYNFCLNLDNSFPYSLSELPRGAIYLFSKLAPTTEVLYTERTSPMFFADVPSLITNEDFSDAATQYILGFVEEYSQP